MAFLVWRMFLYRVVGRLNITNTDVFQRDKISKQHPRLCDVNLHFDLQKYPIRIVTFASSGWWSFIIVLWGKVVITKMQQLIVFFLVLCSKYIAH